MSSSESWVVFISNDKALNYSALDWMPYGNNYCTQTPGASVSLTYEYDIAYVWASYHPANKLPAVSATQDGQAARILPPNPIPNNTNPNSSLQWLVVFTQDGLKNHTLEIVADGASAATPFCLWRIDVTAPVRQQSNFAETSPVGSNATTSSSSTLSATSTVPSSTSPPSHASSRGPSTGALVGGVIGAVSLTLLICGALFFWYRRQHKHRYAPTDLDDDDSGRSSPTSVRKSAPLRPFFLPRVFPQRKPTEPGWLETRPPVTLIPHIRRPSSPDLPHPASPPSRSSTENSPRPISERTVRLSELGLAVSSDSRDVLPEASRRHPTTSEEIESPESLHASSPVYSLSTNS